MLLSCIEHPYLKQFTKSFILKTEEGSLLIDTGLKSGTQKIEALAPDPKIIISTHGHWDHMGGHAYFQKKGAKIFAGAGDIRILGSLNVQWDTMYEQFREDFSIPLERQKVFAEEAGENAFADGVLREGMRMEFGQAVLQFMEIPGHSDGSICISLPEEGVLFTGDTVCGGGFFGTIPQISNVAAYMKTLKRLSDMDADRVFAAHLEEPLTNAAFHEAVNEGRNCCERLQKWTQDFLRMKREAFTVGQLAGYLCEKEGGKPVGSGACITALAFLKEYGKPFEGRLRGGARYIL